MRDAGTVTVIEARDDGDVEGPPSAKAAPLMGHPRYCPQSGGPGPARHERIVFEVSTEIANISHADAGGASHPPLPFLPSLI